MGPKKGGWESKPPSVMSNTTALATAQLCLQLHAAPQECMCMCLYLSAGNHKPVQPLLAWNKPAPDCLTQQGGAACY